MREFRRDFLTPDTANGMRQQLEMWGLPIPENGKIAMRVFLFCKDGNRHPSTPKDISSRVGLLLAQLHLVGRKTKWRDQQGKEWIGTVKTILACSPSEIRHQTRLTAEGKKDRVDIFSACVSFAGHPMPHPGYKYVYFSNLDFVDSQSHADISAELADPIKVPIAGRTPAAQPNS
jgi:hypothetical protein